MAASTQNYKSLVAVEVAEAMAMLYGVHFAAEMGIGPFGIESDSSSLVFMINSRVIPRSDVGLVLSDIIQLIDSSSVIHGVFIPRNCNAVVYGLARFSLSVVEPLHWLGDSPPCVAALVVAEASHQL
ncbi:hypothetical protein ACOSQ3_018443 [Xanthoceras sorbifolium]